MDTVSRMRSYVSYYTFFAFVRAQADNDNFIAYLKTWYSADRTIRSHTLYAGKQNTATAAKPAGKEKLENLHDLSRKKNRSRRQIGAARLGRKLRVVPGRI